MSKTALLALVLAAPLSPVHSQGPHLGAQTDTAAGSERGPVTVFFADGTSLPLRAWSLSYEYAAWKKGDGPARGTIARHEAKDLFNGGRTLLTPGLVIEVQYAGGATKGLVVLAGGGKRTTMKPESPAVELLAPGLGKDMVVQGRGLDIRGETLTGSKRDYCLLSYTALVECAAPDPGQRVVKLEFPKMTAGGARE